MRLSILQVIIDDLRFLQNRGARKLIMKRFSSIEMQTAYENGGYRERFAMENGSRTIICVNGHKCFKFTYPSQQEYQDANGATYDTVAGVWID